MSAYLQNSQAITATLLIMQLWYVKKKERKQSLDSCWLRLECLVSVVQITFSILQISVKNKKQQCEFNEPAFARSDNEHMVQIVLRLSLKCCPVLMMPQCRKSNRVYILGYQSSKWGWISGNAVCRQIELQSSSVLIFSADNNKKSTIKKVTKYFRLTKATQI